MVKEHNDLIRNRYDYTSFPAVYEDCHVYCYTLCTAACCQDQCPLSLNPEFSQPLLLDVFFQVVVQLILSIL